MENKNIYQLELHESVLLPCGISIMRVPGGWLYDMWNNVADTSKPGTFIPFSSEFKPA